MPAAGALRALSRGLAPASFGKDPQVNRRIEVARRFHDQTSHTWWSVHSNPHWLDFDNMPRPFKLYRDDLESLPLPLPREAAAGPALSALAAPPSGPRRPTLEDLARILHYSAGIMKVRRFPGLNLAFRAAACTGALYHVDLYPVTRDLEGLPAGVYHYGPQDSRLRLLRPGCHLDVLAAATAAEPAVARASAVVALACTYWRNAWKYQARTYRHFGWDTGTILANMLALAAGLGISARLVMGFVDEEVNRLLGLDPLREVAFCLVALGREEQALEPRRRPLEALDLPLVPYSAEEVDYPLMREMHAASSLAEATEVADWRRATLEPVALPPAAQVRPLRLPARWPADPLEQVIRRRGSARRFRRQPLGEEQLGLILERACRPVPADFPGPLNELWLIVNAVEGLEPGSYRLRPEGLELLKQGAFRGQAGHLALDQELAADASVCLFFLADLERVLRSLGNRGYRCLHTEAGLVGGRMYLAAYALGLGATGLTFYDLEVVEFFSPRAAGRSAVFLMALGIPAPPGRR